ncbi:TPA: hypothetical protein ACGE6U_003143 [Serratia marcescens]|uniref:hypothetical protein n=1 Tax=Serratia marcescens TaxID=615 RepID=UPI0036F4DBF4
MTLDSIVTLVGAIVTIVSTAITIFQVRKAKNYKEQIKFDIRKINLSGTTERLKRSQDDIRMLPSDYSKIQRGLRVEVLIHNIKSQFDFALNAIDKNGPDKDIRTLLTNAQNKLNSYELAFLNKKIDPKDSHELQSLVQDAISQSSSRIFALEGKS